jgi:DNA-binding CsgD family transcriptional regulator
LVGFLGLDETVSAVYQALLAVGGGTADIGTVTGLPEGDIRTALAALAGLNLVRSPFGMSDSWRVVRPELGFAALVHKREADLAALRAAIAEADAAWSARLQRPWGEAEPIEDWRDAVAEAFRLAGQAVTDFALVMPGAPEPLALLHADLSRYETAVAGGTRIRALYHDSTRSNRAGLALAKRAARAGAEVRTAPVLPLPMVVCDVRAALIQAGPGRREAALSVREPSIVAVLAAVFGNAWDTATPLGTPIVPDESTGLTPLEQGLLRLLADGLTDKVAGRELGVSESTVSRLMKDLMTRFGATSRFQAGHIATQRGWL